MYKYAMPFFYKIAVHDSDMDIFSHQVSVKNTSAACDDPVRSDAAPSSSDGDDVTVMQLVSLVTQWSACDDAARFW